MRVWHIFRQEIVEILRIFALVSYESNNNDVAKLWKLQKPMKIWQRWNEKFQEDYFQNICQWQCRETPKTMLYILVYILAEFQASFLPRQLSKLLQQIAKTVKFKFTVKIFSVIPRSKEILIKVEKILEIEQQQQQLKAATQSWAAHCAAFRKRMHR